LLLKVAALSHFPVRDLLDMAGIILKLILGKYCWEYTLDLSDQVYGPVTDACKNGNKNSGSIDYGNVLDYLSFLLGSE
jgi:hypothetical protein